MMTEEDLMASSHGGMHTPALGEATRIERGSQRAAEMQPRRERPEL